MGDQPKGQMVRIPTHYDPRQSKWSPQYDPNYGDRGTITGRDSHQPPKER